MQDSFMLDFIRSHNQLGFSAYQNGLFIEPDFGSDFDRHFVLITI